MSAAAGFAPSSAGSAAPGAPAGSVFVRRAGDARARFAPVEILVGDAVGHLAKRASLELGWGVSAAYVDLFLVKPGGEDEPSAAEEEEALKQPRLQVGRPLPRAGVASGAWVVARLPDAPAAAPLPGRAPPAGAAAGPGECAHASRVPRLPLLALLSGGVDGPGRGSAFARGARGGLCRRAHPHPLPTLLSPLPPFPAASQAAAAVAAAAAAAAVRQRLPRSWNS